MKSSFLVILCLSISSTCFAVDTMYLVSNCQVKELGASGRDLGIRVGELAKIETTTNSDYKTPTIVNGKNLLLIGRHSFQGTAGRFSYDKNSPTGNIFEILGGRFTVVIRQSTPSVYTGKFIAIIKVGSKKIAELSCLEN